jgi:hypothetical protein
MTLELTGALNHVADLAEVSLARQGSNRPVAPAQPEATQASRSGPGEV